MEEGDNKFRRDERKCEGKEKALVLVFSNHSQPGSSMETVRLLMQQEMPFFLNGDINTSKLFNSLQR